MDRLGTTTAWLGYWVQVAALWLFLVFVGACAMLILAVSWPIRAVWRLVPLLFALLILYVVGAAVFYSVHEGPEEGRPCPEKMMEVYHGGRSQRVSVGNSHGDRRTAGERAPGNGPASL